MIRELVHTLWQFCPCTKKRDYKVIIPLNLLEHFYACLCLRATTDVDLWAFLALPVDSQPDTQDVDRSEIRTQILLATASSGHKVAKSFTRMLREVRGQGSAECPPPQLFLTDKSWLVAEAPPGWVQLFNFRGNRADVWAPVSLMGNAAASARSEYMSWYISYTPTIRCSMPVGGVTLSHKVHTARLCLSFVSKVFLSSCSSFIFVLVEGQLCVIPELHYSVNFFFKSHSAEIPLPSHTLKEARNSLSGSNQNVIITSGAFPVWGKAIGYQHLVYISWSCV